jgi:hypothetical protein
MDFNEQLVSGSEQALIAQCFRLKGGIKYGKYKYSRCSNRKGKT